MSSPFGDLPAAVGTALGSRVTATVHLGGGSISQAHRMSLEDRRSVFVKSHPGGLPQMFRREAEGLQWLTETATVRVPRVLAVGDDEGTDLRFLVLEWIEPGPRSSAWDDELGRSLAALHRFGTGHFGLAQDNFIATIEQRNTPTESWAEFYATNRLAPLVHAARDQGRLTADTVTAFDRLYERLDVLVGPPEPPARLHGDLWAGNAVADMSGDPWLVDPAVYGGHREVDLAMMRLFGGFGDACFRAYDEVHPLADGHEERVGLYQLYPLLVHVVLFGGGYASTLTHQLARYL